MKQNAASSAGISGASKMAKTHNLTTGSLTLNIERSHDAMTRKNRLFGPLFQLAERQNPKRAFLFVSTVLGRHIPVAPKTHRAALHALADSIVPLINEGVQGPILIMGYAETAVGLGAGVFDCLRKDKTNPAAQRQMIYSHTTRHPIPGTEVWFTIEEGHSHATHHNIIKPKILPESGPDATLILVDDEITTGNSFAQLVLGFAENGLRFGRIILVSLTDWSGGAAVDQVSKISPNTVVTAVSLMSGSWTWQADPHVALPCLPRFGQAGCPIWHPDSDGFMTAPRQGITGQEMSSGTDLIEKINLKKMKSSNRLLVIGSGEHVWQPFLYAEAQANTGRDVGLICTTRSPILPGPVIAHKITFPDHFGIGLDMYLHNVDPEAWDDIILFTETGSEGVHPKLRAALGKGYIVDRAAKLCGMMDFTKESRS